MQDDSRRYIALSTFGFYQGGILDVRLQKFHMSEQINKEVYNYNVFYFLYFIYN